MSSTQNDSYALGGTLMTLAVLGASVFPTMVKTPNISGGVMRINTLGSGATIQILPIAMAGASIGGATAMSASLIGYPFAAADTISWEGPAAFYLACTGAASTVQLLFKYSAGATLA